MFRLLAVVCPISHRMNSQLTRTMLTSAWILAFLSSLPHSYLFHLVSHPLVRDYIQCSLIGSFSSVNMVTIGRLSWYIQFFFQEFLYFLFVVSMTFIIPLLIMVGSYITIVIMIYKQSKKIKNNERHVKQRSSKYQTIRLTGTLVLCFFICWTPYYCITFW